MCIITISSSIPHINICTHTSIIYIVYINIDTHTYVHANKHERTNERKEGRKKDRQKERQTDRKAYFYYGMTDDILVHVNDTTRDVMTCW